ncbi:MAG: methylmalonyl-CoA mutase, partial [Anaerolineae bacterium]|nr:methylmalonyl-CoA mutase [Anaerolineae bacterium]
MGDTERNTLTEAARTWEERDVVQSVRRVPERAEAVNVQRLHTPLDAGPQPPPDADQQWYLDNLGFPGQYPFTRGVQPTMYRSRF